MSLPTLPPPPPPPPVSLVKKSPHPASSKAELHRTPIAHRLQSRLPNMSLILYAYRDACVYAHEGACVAPPDRCAGTSASTQTRPRTLTCAIARVTTESGCAIRRRV